MKLWNLSQEMASFIDIDLRLRLNGKAYKEKELAILFHHSRLAKIIISRIEYLVDYDNRKST